MIRYSLIWLKVLLVLAFVFGEFSSANAFLGPALNSLSRYLSKPLKQAPKQGDELPSLKSSPKSLGDETVLNGPLVTRSLSRSSHYLACPSMNLRVSVPQLNVGISVPDKLNVRSGPGINYSRQGQFSRSGTYTLDLVNTSKCWVKIRYKTSRGKNNTGWIYSKLLRFEFDDHLTKPQKRLTRNLGATGVYKMVARSTYKIATSRATGTAVAISPTVLLTNCHVLGSFQTVHIIENRGRHLAHLIHDDHSKDKCFIRSLFFELRPVPSIQNYSRIRRGEDAFTIGAPLGINRSLGRGVVFRGSQQNGINWIDATAPVEPGSSGGGLFDAKGNLLGITTIKVTTYSGRSYSKSIAAADFWQ